MSSNFHLEMFSSGDAYIVLKIRQAPGWPVILERRVNVIDVALSIAPPRTLRKLETTIEEQCHIWYERTINLKAYCQRALQWTGTTSLGEVIRLKSITQRKVELEYEWRGHTYPYGLRFSDGFGCIDWVDGRGLTQYAVDWITQGVESDIQRRIEGIAQDRIEALSIVQQFLAPLERHRDLPGEIADALIPWMRSPPVRDTIPLS